MLNSASTVLAVVEGVHLPRGAIALACCKRAIAPGGIIALSWKADTRQGEKALAYDLYEYLHDQGLQFNVEPESASGRVDLISAQSGKDRLLADTKIFNPGGGQTCGYLAKGFRQVYDYTRDYNEQFGYIVIFKTCEDDLAIQTSHQESLIPVVMHNHKAIFLLVIDIYPHEKPASQRGKLKTHAITSEDLILAAATTDTGQA